MNIKQKFARYVSQNILGMIGLSCYILADSFFISKAQGANGLTALNLVLPLYNLIFAIGSMIGVGAAIRYSIAKFTDAKEADKYLPNALFFTTVIGLIFSMIGIFLPGQLLQLLGADAVIVEVGTSYIRIFMIFAPIFMWNYVANAYVRNDGAPTVAMLATLLSSLFNIIFDYILMFPLHMGMSGAALATAFSPIVGIGICCIHLCSSKSHVKLKFCFPSIKRLWKSCQLGVSAFVAEMSSGVITIVFNFLILGLAGNVGVAAYGVVANVSLVAVSVFNGIAQGSQPLISDSYGKKDMKAVHTLRNLSFILSVVLAAVIYGLLFLFADHVIEVFNQDHNMEFAAYARVGVKLYFTGIFFAGANIVGSSFFSATEKVREAFAVSMLRGFILITISAFVMSALFGMNGVWLAYMVAELSTCMVMVMFLVRGRGVMNEKKIASV